MRRRSRQAGGLTVLLALALVHLLFPVFVVYSWIVPTAVFTQRAKQDKQSRSRLEDCIRRAERRSLAAPEPVLCNPYDGACLGRNRIHENLQGANEECSD